MKIAIVLDAGIVEVTTTAHFQQRGSSVALLNRKERAAKRTLATQVASRAWRYGRLRCRTFGVNSGNSGPVALPMCVVALLLCLLGRPLIRCW